MSDSRGPRTLRAFIAVPLSEKVTEGLAALQKRLARTVPHRSVRWVAPENIHLTLRFLGDILHERVDPIKEALSVVARNVPPFSFTVEQLGAFPNLRRPRVVWVGVVDSSSWLALLHEVLSESLEQLGFSREARRFSPHLTLGRVARRAAVSDVSRVGATVTDVKIGTIGTVPVERVILFQSDLQPSGAVYTPLATFRLHESSTSGTP